jgi:hypothetical protein
MRRVAIPVLTVTLILLTSSTAAALEQRGNHTLAFYGYAPFMDGDLSFGENETQVDLDASDIFDSLELAAMARYRGQTETWAFVVDAQFAGLGDTAEAPLVTTDLDLDLYIVHVDAAYRFAETAEVLFGVRYVRFDTTVDLRLVQGGAIHRENDASLFDPVIGLRTLRPISDRWLLQAQGDVGGGGDMDFSWQAMVHLGYQSSESLSWWFGYRALGMDFDDSGGRNRFSADIVLHGPAAGVAFHF